MITFKHEFNLGITTISMDCSEHSNLILAFHQVVRITNRDTNNIHMVFLPQMQGKILATGY
jgi:hypothetical protein